MAEPHREELQVCDKDGKGKMVGQLGMSLTNSSTAESMPEPLDVSPSDAVAEPKVSGDHGIMLELQNALAENSKQLSETEAKLKAAVEEAAMLTRELEMSQKLLDESQVLALQLCFVTCSFLVFVLLFCFNYIVELLFPVMFHVTYI
jgi:hypothetical protein